MKSFIVVAESEFQKKEWFKVFQHTINKVQRKQNLNLKSANNSSHHSSHSVPPILTNRPQYATLYLPENFSELCMKCRKKFSVTRRKKYCTHCGLLICAKCLTDQLPHFTQEDKVGRVCSDC